MNTRYGLILFFFSSLFIGAGEEGVVLFDRADFTGRSQVFTEDISNLRGSYIGNDRAISVMVSHGWTVTLYEHADFKGKRVFLKHSATDLRRLPIGRHEVSSMRITPPQIRRESRPAAPRRGDRGRPEPQPKLPPQAISQPVILYKHKNFRGKHEAFTGDDPDLRNNRVGNDRVSSLQVPPGCVVTLFEHVNYGGRSETFEGDDHNLKNNVIGNDRASSIKIRWAPDVIPNRAPRPGVTLFSKYHFKGRSDVIFKSCSAMSETRIGNDNLGSIRVPMGYRVTLFEDRNFRGRSEILLSDDAGLRDNRIGVNTVSSIRIEWVGAEKPKPKPRRRR